MKKTVIMCLLLFMFFVLTGSAMAANGNTTYQGEQTGFSIYGVQNTFIGETAGFSNTPGQYCSDNTFVGYGSGYHNVTGYQNTFIGEYSGWSNVIGALNTIIGNDAGYFSTSDGNTFLGFQTGNNNTGGYNVFLGLQAGYYETGSNKLYIANSDTATPLIYGEFDNNILSTPGYLGVGTKTPARQLHLVGDNATFRMDRTKNSAAFILVRTDTSGNPMKTFVVGANASGSNDGTFVINDLGTNVSGGGTNRMTINNDGSVNFTGTITAAGQYLGSSIALKNNVRTYENALDTVSKLRGVKFDWKDSGKPAVGLIAEEVDKVVPEVVAHNDGNATGVNYASLVGVLVEAVKEQQKTIATLSAKVDTLEHLLSSK